MGNPPQYDPGADPRSQQPGADPRFQQPPGANQYQPPHYQPQYSQNQPGPPAQYQYAPPQNDAEVAQKYRDQLMARCASNNHDWKTEYGCYGIIMAVLFFPFGFICFFMDKKSRCTRCGVSKN